MQQSAAWESMGQEVVTFEILRSRTRTRRRRRKQSWLASGILLVAVVLIYNPFWIHCLRLTAPPNQTTRH